MPKINNNTAQMHSNALVRSRRPACSSRNSGNSQGPTSSNSTITGTASRNTEPHQKNASMTPPTSGPIALPTIKPVIQMVIARVRSCST